MNTNVETLGDCEIESPLKIPQFIEDRRRILVDIDYEVVVDQFKKQNVRLFENAGPRKRIFFNPTQTRVGIVTCGGLCPGLNNVIQSIVRMLYFQYGVKAIYGIQYGYEGLIPEYGHSLLPLTPDVVRDIHQKGGSILGTSRGPQNIAKMVDQLVANDISILFTVGGDGTLRGALAIHEEIKRRGLNISIAGVPKTIDNDILFEHRTFGFETAVAIAVESIHAASAEARSARNGIGLVKVMGRDSGFIASYAAIASNEVNFALIPEVPFSLEGDPGLLSALKGRLAAHGHAVILVAEGAGQNLFPTSADKDRSGNVKYGDIGLLMCDSIRKYFSGNDVVLKYIDPSYLIRSVPASADDSIFCIMLAQNAVHGAMSGKAGFVVGFWNQYYTFMPLSCATEKRKRVEPNGYLWTMVREATGQPDLA